MPQDLHVYQRHIEKSQRTSLTVLIDLIKPESQVLDLGCGSGSLGTYLHQQMHCTVDGVTISEEEAALAKKSYREVLVADLDTLPVQAYFQKKYDYIVCADVLEHLKDPARILKECKELLKPNGQLLISIPNASYSGLILELMHGEWKYRAEGLLDSTHLRFFTRTSLLRFLQEQAWHVESLDVVERMLDDSEFQHTHPDTLPPAVLRHLMAQPDALTYQFICAATPAAQPQVVQSQAWQKSTTDGLHATFASNLYWGEAGQFSESHKHITRGHIGRQHQNLQFEVARFEAHEPVLRWDPANRPGYLHLHHMHLRDSEGALVWAWDMEQHLPHTTRHDIVFQAAPATAYGTTLLLLEGDDPWMHIPVPPQLLRQALDRGPVALDIAVSWPLSADYVLLANRTQTLKADLSRSDREVVKWRHEYDQQVQQHQQHVQQASEKIHSLHLDIASLSGQIHAFQSSKAYRISRKLAAIKQKLKPQRAPAPIPAQAPAPVEAAAHHVQPLTADVTPPQAHVPSAPEAAMPAQEVPPTMDTAAPSAPATVEAVPAPDSGPRTSAPARVVDVIIPVYRSLSDTQQCLLSVMAELPKQKTAFQVIVINDASPDADLTAWLRTYAPQHDAITLIENPSNLGFVGSVNKGMALHPDHDVLLLNSDTEVANDWLDRLRQAAYREAHIGSVTPLSSNATICSYPRFCASNPLPAGYSTAQMDQLCAQHNPGAAVDIPTGVGFCMYIRRDCLAQTGYFDEAHFGKGYGEENDFCMRAHHLGWKHVLALDTYVLHTGGVSFGDSKTPREQAAYALLQQLHPDYDTLVQAHLKANPAQDARHRLDIARLQQSTLPKVLMVVHNVGGGTLRHVQELAAHLQTQAISLCLTPLPDHMVRLDWLHPDEAYSQEFDWSTESGELIELLQQLGVQHVHFHHLLGWAPDILQLPERLGVTYDFTAHDYYAACPQISVSNADGSYCGERGVEQCRQCLQKRPAPTQESIEDWRFRHRMFLNQARHVFAPSNDCAKRMQHYFPDAPIQCVPHLDIAATDALPQPQGYPVSARANLRVFVLGGVSANKGGNILEATALAAARSKAALEFHLIGYPHRQVACQPASSLTIHGPYEDRNLPLLLERLQPDVVWFPALWPETYSYTLSACLQAGLPVVAPDIGAFSERLSARPWTWLRPWHTSPEEWLQFFTQLRDKHFVQSTSVPVAPTWAGDTLVPASARWSYAQNYLQSIGSTTGTPTSTAA